MSSIRQKRKKTPRVAVVIPKPLRRLQRLLANERPPEFYSIDQLRSALREVVEIEAAPWTPYPDGSGEFKTIENQGLAGLLSAWLHLDKEEGAGPEEFEASAVMRDALAWLADESLDADGGGR